jgi:hypothetical protein
MLKSKSYEAPRVIGIRVTDAPDCTVGEGNIKERRIIRYQIKRYQVLYIINVYRALVRKPDGKRPQG